MAEKYAADEGRVIVGVVSAIRYGLILITCVHPGYQFVCLLFVLDVWRAFPWPLLSV